MSRLVAWLCAAAAVLSALLLAMVVGRLVVHAVFTSPWSQLAHLVGAPLAFTALLLAWALPITALLAFCVALTAAIEADGKFVSVLRVSTRLMSGMSPVVAGVAAALLTSGLHAGAVEAMVAALVALNAPMIAGECIELVVPVVGRYHIAAAALGGSAGLTARSVILPSVGTALRSRLFSAAARMLGQTAVVAVVAGPAPLTVALWRDAANPDAAPVNAMRALLLVAIVLLLNRGARLLAMPSSVAWSGARGY